eukprot:5484063-Amphidinium_carterae.1
MQALPSSSGFPVKIWSKSWVFLPKAAGTANFANVDVMGIMHFCTTQHSKQDVPNATFCRGVLSVIGPAEEEAIH